MTEMTVKEFCDRMKRAEGCGGGINTKTTCGSKPWEFQTNDVVEVLSSFVDDSEGYGAGITYGVLKLKDGRFGTFWEWSDTSGHG